MVLELVLKENKVFPWVFDYPRKNREAEEILRVLKRAAVDDSFIGQLTDLGSRALQGYDLSWQAKSALVGCDLGWIEARVGKLTPKLRTWIDCRLQQEIW